MGRTQALSIYVSEDVKAELRNKIAGVFENLAKKTISGMLKSKNGTLNEKAGSFEFKRFANATRQAYGTASGVTIDKTKPIVPQLEAAIVAMETTENEYVDGVDRELMALVLSPELYGLVKTELNDCYNFAGTVADQVFKGINGVASFSSNRLPAGVDFELIVMDSVAQPVMINGADIEKIPLSNEYAVEIFYRNGTKVLAKELAHYGSFKA